jgi:hypothetical protein
MREVRLLAILALLAAACRDSAGPPAQSDASAPSPRGVAWRSFVFEGPFNGTSPVAGVEVCVVEGAPRQCVASGPDGIFTLRELPPSHPMLLVYSKEGFVPTLQPMVTPRWSASTIAPGFSVRMLSLDDTTHLDAANSALASIGRAPIERDTETRGVLGFGRYSVYTLVTLPPGAVAMLDPQSGEGPFAFGAPPPQFGDTPAVLGASHEGAYYGSYFGVEQGEYELVWNEASGRCKWAPGPNAGWKPTSGRENAARTVVRPGHRTYWTSLECPIDAAQWYADWVERTVGDAGVDAGAP